MANNIKLDEASLEFILNMTLDNLKEDRSMALRHHSTLSSLLSGASGDEALSGLEIQMMVQELSMALTNFLKSAATSTEQGLKMAKILADLITKMPSDDTLTDEDRASIESMIGKYSNEKENIDTVTNVIQMDEIVNDQS